MKIYQVIIQELDSSGSFTNLGYSISPKKIIKQVYVANKDLAEAYKTKYIKLYEELYGITLGVSAVINELDVLDE